MRCMDRTALTPLALGLGLLAAAVACVARDYLRTAPAGGYAAARSGASNT